MIIAPPLSELVHSVVPVHIDQSSGDISVCETTYRGGGNGLHLLALKRKGGIDNNGNPLPPVLVSGRVVTNTSAAGEFFAKVSAAEKDVLLIANGVGNYENIPYCDLVAFGGPYPLPYTVASVSPLLSSQDRLPVSVTEAGKRDGCVSKWAPKSPSVVISRSIQLP